MRLLAGSTSLRMVQLSFRYRNAKVETEKAHTARRDLASVCTLGGVKVMDPPLDGAAAGYLKIGIAKL